MEEVKETPMSLNDIRDQDRLRVTQDDIQNDISRNDISQNDIGQEGDQEIESSNAEEEFFMEDQEIAPSNADALVSNNASEPRDYPCQYCDEVFRSRQQRHYHVKIARKCVGLQGLDPQMLKKRASKDESRAGEASRRSAAQQQQQQQPQQQQQQQQPQQQQPEQQLANKFKDRIKSSMKASQRRHSCPKCGKLFGKPSHVKRHLFTCRGPTFQRTSPIKNTSAAYYKQMQHVIMSGLKSSSSTSSKTDFASASTSSSLSLGQQRKMLQQQQRQMMLQNMRRQAASASIGGGGGGGGRSGAATSTSTRESRSTQSNFLAFGIESMEDLVTLMPQFLTLEGWTYNLLQDGLAMIQCVLDTDSLECNWSKTVLIRSYLENDDPTTFEVIIKSKVPGYDYLMLEEQTVKLTCVADVFEAMGIPLEEEEDVDESQPTEILPSAPIKGGPADFAAAAAAADFASSSGSGGTREKLMMDQKMMDRFLPFGGAGVGGGGENASTSAASASAAPRVGGVGGVVNEEGDEELTDDESHSVGDDQEPAPDVAAALSSRHKGKERVCRVCGVSGFAHRQALYRHIKKTHPHNQSWSCPICREEFNCQNTFMDHYDHHRILAQGEPESRAVAFEKANVEKFMESVEEDEEGVANVDKVPVSCSVLPEDATNEEGGDGSSTSAAAAAAAAACSANAIKRRKACGDCPPCRITENCEECTACRTRATSKQKCERRKCLNMIFNKFEDHQQYEVKQLLFSEWALQKTLSQAESSSSASDPSVAEVIKEGKAKKSEETKKDASMMMKVMKTFWKCKLCDLTFPTKDKGVVLSHIATCHGDTDFSDV